MDFKIEINRLPRTDLEYELLVRGAAIGQSINSMRSILRQLLRLESSPSYHAPAYPFTFAEDSVAIEAKLESIRLAISTFSGDRRHSDFTKLSTGLAHVYGRINNSQPTSAEQTQSRSDYLLRTAILSAELLDKAARSARASSRVRSSVLEPPLSDHEDSSDSLESVAPDDEPINMLSPIAPPSTVTPSPYALKPVPVSAWGIKFSGNAAEQSVNAFLERVSELKCARNSNDALLFRSAIDLFTGPALIWYRANRDLYSCWKELAEALRSEFLIPDYDDKLFEEIKRRTQGPAESIGIYTAIMHNLFARLSTKVSETMQLKIILKNLTPFYQTQLGLVDITSLTQLLRLGKQLEARKASVEAYVPPPLRVKSIEPDLAYLGHPNVAASAVPSTSASPRTPTVSRATCWNCSKAGHVFNNCPSPRHKFCYRCGQRNVTVNTCRRCSGNANLTH